MYNAQEKLLREMARSEPLAKRARAMSDAPKADSPNGIKLLRVVRVDDDHAELEVYFYNDNYLKTIVDKYQADNSQARNILPISGGTRILAGSALGQVQVDSSGAPPNAAISHVDGESILRLVVKPVGDYSTYTLRVSGVCVRPSLFDPLFSEIHFKFRPGCFNNNCAPEWESALPPLGEPAIDYLAKDYDSFRATMIEAMMRRVPEWEPTSEADLDMVLAELFSVAADELSDYQDRVMNEAYIASARKRVSLARHSRLVDYHIHQGSQASTRLALEIKEDSGGVIEFWLDKGLKVWAGDSKAESNKKKETDSSVVFVSRNDEPQVVHQYLNNIGLYTWSDTITTLKAGSTRADLKLYKKLYLADLTTAVAASTKAEAKKIRNLIRAGNIQYLVIQEHLNPETGFRAGRDPAKRQLLKLIPGREGADAVLDPITGEWFVRVRWEKADSLRHDYCFTVDCSSGKVENISLFHGNLIEVFHGRSEKIVFKDQGEPIIIENVNLTFPSLDVSVGYDSITITTHGLVTGQPIRLITGGTLPGGLLPSATYYIIRVDADTFQFATNVWNAFAGTVVDLTSSGSGSSTMTGDDNPLEFYYERTRWGTLCRLPETALAYRQTDTGGDVPPHSTLKLTVETPGGDSEEWNEVPSLIHSDDSAENGDHFVVETDENRRSSIRFGNGKNGMDLPSGAQVVCEYQYGLPLEGNVGADSILNFDADEVNGAPAPKIETCWNPFDVINGIEREPVAEIIRRVPEAYRQRQLRAITLSDYVDRAKGIEGVSAATAAYAWTGSWRTVRITIDPTGSTELSATLRKEVASYLNAVRLIGEDIEIRPPVFVPLDIRVTLCAAPDVWPDDIRFALEQEFSAGWTPDGRMGFFHPDNWTFGQKLFASQIIGRALQVKGVEHAVEQGIGGGKTISVYIKRWNSPFSADESLTQLAPNEIIRVENDPDNIEAGFIKFEIKGGRQ